MTSKITFRSGFEITGALQYRAFPTNFQDTVEGAKGPSPGAITASVEGTDIDLSEVMPAGYCRIQNQDANNYVEVGLHDGTDFYPFAEIAPLLWMDYRISRHFGFTVPDAGTGTGANGITLRVRGMNQPCNVFVGAFQK